MKKTNLQESFPYKTGDEGYNRRSGKKTLVLVGICIALVTIFSILAVISVLSL
jgi:hypothetical protein